MPDSQPSGGVRVYVNAVGLTVPAGATALDAVRQADPGAADAVVAGTRVITDSRGLVLDADTPAHGGAIYRLASARMLREAIDEEQPL